MPEKNKIYKVDIDGMNNLGYGICRINGVVCFVKGGVPGDALEIRIIKVAKNYCVGKIETLLSPSAHRADPVCPVYKRCGGCCFRHVTYEKELELKKSFVEAELKKVGISAEVEDVFSTGMTGRYRNKAQYPVDFENRIGFFSEKTHEICETGDCLLQPEIFSSITGEIKRFMNLHGLRGYDEKTGKGLVRHIYVRRGKETGETNVCLAINGDSVPFSDELVERLKKIDGVVGVCLNINKENTNVILGDRYITLFGKDQIEDVLCGFRFRISPASFYQVNHDCAEKLYDRVFELVSSGKHDQVTDLYCGTGTIGLTVAGRLGGCRLTGVEIVREAIENAKLNAALNGIENADFICADSSETRDGILESSDVVILDPPRKGVSNDLIEKIAKSGVPRIVYVSCSPDTLARDLRRFADLGYSCGHLFPYDMFPRTSHVETVALITRAG